MGINKFLKYFGDGGNATGQEVADVENEIIKNIGFDESFEKIYLNLISRYSETLKGTLRKMLEVAITLKDDESKRLQYEAIKETFNLNDKELTDYLLIVRIEKMYMDMNQELDIILEMISEDKDLYSELEDEIKGIIERKKVILSLVDKFSSKDKQSGKYSFIADSSNDAKSYPVELSTNSNFIIYLSNVEKERLNTVSSKSGKGSAVMGSICKEITILNKSNYELLRQNGKIHQINVSGKRYTGRVLTSDNIAYERIGGVCTKVAYARIPILQSNLELLKGKYKNTQLRYIMVVICFGDFKSEGINEEKLYERFNLTATDNMNELEKIIKIFKEPFTSETFEEACSIIERGVDIIKLLSDSPMKSLNESDSFSK